jgi:hypothetical protein
MLKRIPKSDISIRPFKAYKEWSFNESSAPIAGVYVFSASIGNVVNDFPTASVYIQQIVNILHIILHQYTDN